MNDDFKYNVSILNSLSDFDIATYLADCLASDGLSVWVNDEEDATEQTLKSELEDRLEVSQILVFLMSPDAFASEWATLESYTAIFRNPDSERHFIPVLIEDTEIPEVLRQYNYVDWRNESPIGYEILLDLCIHFSQRLDENDDEIAIEKITPEKTLTFHTREISKVKTAFEGQLVVSSAMDNTIKVWDLSKRKFLASFTGHRDYIYGLAITPNGETIVSGSDDTTVRVWDVDKKQLTSKFTGHRGWVRAVAITADGKTVISGSDDKTIRIWDVETGGCLRTLTGHKSWVRNVCISENGRYIISSSDDGEVRFWDLEAGEYLANNDTHNLQEVSFISENKILLKSSRNAFSIWNIKEDELTNYKGRIPSLTESSISKDKKLIVNTGSLTIQLYDAENDKDILIFEGHTDFVDQAIITPDGKIIVSTSEDGTTRIWEAETGDCIRVLGMLQQSLISVIRGEDDNLIISAYRVHQVIFWQIENISSSFSSNKNEVRYTNAKVLLVGETGVGKSGLAHRLVENKFVETISSDGVWASQMKLDHDSGIAGSEREIWLWDFAGQSDYRLIHQLYMDETALAVLIFNPQQENPFEGLGQWDRDIQRAARRPFKKLLVAGRCDRGGLTVSRKSIDDFRQERDFAEYLETSARTGVGCRELQTAIIKNINWDDIPYTSSPHIFKLLKEEIVKFKDEGKILLRLSELKQQLNMLHPKEVFSIEELNAVIGLLAGPGIIKKLEFGDFILLKPEIINSYAAAVIRSVRTHTDEIGCINEDKVLTGDLDYQDLQRLPTFDEEIVLRAMHQMLVARGICLRESSGSGVLLVFPSLFKRERPELGEHPSIFITYQFDGNLEEIYSTLIVRLSHTSAFNKEQLWRFAADFRTESGKRVGLKMLKRQEGAAEITIYFEPDVADDIKVLFVRYVHEHLQSKSEKLRRFRHYVCLECGTSVANQEVVQKKLEQGKEDIICVNCEKRVLLWDLLEDKFSSIESQQTARQMLQRATALIDNESRELVLVGHAFSIAGEAGQIYRQLSNSDWGIDGEIEFKDKKGNASGKRLYLQLKSGDSYLRVRKKDNKEIFSIKSERHAAYWQEQSYPVMLVIRTSNNGIRWMNITEYLQNHGAEDRQIVFDGEPFTAANLAYMRDRILNY